MLPAGAPMWYDLDPQFVANIVGPKGGTNQTEIGTDRITLDPIILAVYPKIHVQDVATRRFNILDREQERAQHELAKLEDDKVFQAFYNQDLSYTDSVNAINGINPVVTSTNGLDITTAAAAFAEVEQYDIPVANIVINAQQQKDLRQWTNRNFDPISQRELLKTGYLGDQN